jgi:hypothetical protein
MAAVSEQNPMTKHNDESEVHEDLHRLLVALALGDASAAELEQLNNLLCSDIELRRLAARFLEEEAALRHEFRLLDRVCDYHNPLPEIDRGVCSATTSTQRANDRTNERRTRHLAPYWLLASVLVVAAGGAFWVMNHAGRFGAGSDEEATAAASLEMSQSLRPLTMTASILPPVTRVSWTGPQFAAVSSASPASHLYEGVVPFTSVHDRRAEGYMVHLPPDAVLELVVTADAEGENSLAVIEFDADGRPTGPRVSFSNSLAEVEQPAVDDGSIGPRTRFGPIGTWVERNNSTRSKYYCFVSVHKLLNRSEDDTWHESRLSVQLEEPNLAHVGWDDSGMAHLDNPAETQEPDLDFDDLSATIRIHRPGRKSTQPPGVLVSPGPPAATIQGFSSDAAFPISVDRDEAVFVNVTNRFRTPTTIAVIEKHTGKVWWSYRASDSASSCGGVCALENRTNEKREFVIVGRRDIDAGGSASTSKELKPLTRFEQESFVSVVFDEGPNDQDFDDVKVDVVTMKPL